MTTTNEPIPMNREEVIEAIHKFCEGFVKFTTEDTSKTEQERIHKVSALKIIQALDGVAESMESDMYLSFLAYVLNELGKGPNAIMNLIGTAIMKERLVASGILDDGEDEEPCNCKACRAKRNAFH